MKLLISFMLLLLEKKKCDISLWRYTHFCLPAEIMPQAGARIAQKALKIFGPSCLQPRHECSLFYQRGCWISHCYSLWATLMNPPFVSSCQTLRNEFDLFRPQTVSLRSTLKISMAIIQRGGGGIINLRNTHGLQFLVSRQKSARKRFHFPNVTGRRNRETSIRLSQIRHFDP